MMFGTMDSYADDFEKVRLKWKGQSFHLTHIYYPPLNAQPIGVVSSFRQCGFNYHLNFNSEEGSFSPNVYPWWSIVENIEHPDGISSCSYIKCLYSEVLYLYWWVHRF